MLFLEANTFCFFSIFFRSFLLFDLLGGPFGLAFHWAFLRIDFWALLFIGLSSSWAFGPCFLLDVPPHRLLGIDLQKWTSMQVSFQIIIKITDSLYIFYWIFHFFFFNVIASFYLFGFDWRQSIYIRRKSIIGIDFYFIYNWK